jgi:hypothetical protein
MLMGSVTTLIDSPVTLRAILSGYEAIGASIFLHVRTRASDHR